MTTRSQSKKEENDYRRALAQSMQLLETDPITNLLVTVPKATTSRNLGAARSTKKVPQTTSDTNKGGTDGNTAEVMGPQKQQKAKGASQMEHEGTAATSSKGKSI